MSKALQSQLALRTAVKGLRPSTTITRPCASNISSIASSSSPRKSRQELPKKFSPSVSIRNASTTTSAPQETTSTLPLLTWNQFFALRKTRRHYQTGSSIFSSLLGTATGAQVLVLSDMDSIVSQIPLDPFISLGLITFACGGLGWLLGPVVGTGLFNLRNSRTRGEMIVKEKEFYNRVRKFRVDPSASSMANPVPDYYGEKISSVQGYRQWLKDQRAFNKKRQTFVK